MLSSRFLMPGRRRYLRVRRNVASSPRFSMSQTFRFGCPAPSLPHHGPGRVVPLIPASAAGPAGRAHSSAERIDDRDAAVVRAVVEVFGEDLSAAHRTGSLDNRGVPVGELEPLAGV